MNMFVDKFYSLITDEYDDKSQLYDSAEMTTLILEKPLVKEESDCNNLPPSSCGLLDDRSFLPEAK